MIREILVLDSRQGSVKGQIRSFEIPCQPCHLGIQLSLLAGQSAQTEKQKESHQAGTHEDREGQQEHGVGHGAP